jgi:hypothetical protein
MNVRHLRIVHLQNLVIEDWTRTLEVSDHLSCFDKLKRCLDRATKSVRDFSLHKAEEESRFRVQKEANYFLSERLYKGTLRSTICSKDFQH